jgi:hypothetical protein
MECGMSDDGCLHCAINEVVNRHVEKRENVDVAELAAKMAESLAELILFAAPEEEQAELLAHAIAHLGEMFLQKRGVGEGDTTH